VKTGKGAYDNAATGEYGDMLEAKHPGSGQGHAPHAPERLFGGGFAEDAIARVVERVRQGGHDVPENVIRRRFAAGMANFQRYYLPQVDEWVLYNNSSSVPVLLDWSEG
jgi:hypothetical protein